MNEGDWRYANRRAVCKHAMAMLGVILRKEKRGYIIQLINLPAHLKMALLTQREQERNVSELLISFESPTPKQHRYIGRNHRFVEQLAHFVLAQAFEKDNTYDLARTTATQVAEMDKENHIGDVPGWRNVV